MLEDGRDSVAANEQQAMAWLERAATQDYAAAQYHLGRFYEHGVGIPEDVEQAGVWYLRAADAGDSQAADAVDRLALAN